MCPFRGSMTTYWHSLFWQWLQRQSRREDSVGEFAREALDDPTFPRWAMSLETLREYAAVQSPDLSRFQALDRAYAEWYGTVEAKEAKLDAEAEDVTLDTWGKD